MARYACSDLHGRYDLAQLVLSNLKDSDTLFFLGDAIDRGPQSWDTLQILLNDPRVCFFIGNHEDFLVKLYGELDSVYIDCYHRFRWEIPSIWDYNGGRDMMQKCDDLRERDPEALQSLVTRISSSCRKLEFVNNAGKTIILSHAGFTPGQEYRDPDMQIWNRAHITNNWPKAEQYKDTYIIHGHTIAEYIPSKHWNTPADGPLFYSNGHKIDLDMGSAYTGWTVTFNLDTFDSIPIEGDHTYDLR